MESFSLIDKKWILCISLSFLGFLILLFCINHNSHGIGSIYLVGLGRTCGEEPINGSSCCDQKLSKSDDGVVVSLVGREDGDKTQVDPVRVKCDIFNGRWVYDPDRYPVYHGPQCPFLSDQVTCRKNGRPDFDYENWRWQPLECEVPRFNGTDTLERWRGKRVIIVGDSLNRNQWESLACLLYSVLPPRRTYVYVLAGDYKVFKSMDYNCTVEFFWSPFLVQTKETDKSKVIKLDTVSESSRHWKGADIMVFNTGHWWVHHAKLKVWDFFEHNGKLEKQMELERSYKIALRTWARWIEDNVDPTKTSVFFRSISPEHKGDGRGKKHWCYNQTQPISAAAYESYSNPYPSYLIEITERTLEEMRFPVKYLDITGLSEYRRDAHTTVYTVRQEKLLTEEQRKQPQTFCDCSHWCLPGLPDIWNELMHAWMVLDTSVDIPLVAHRSVDRRLT